MAVVTEKDADGFGESSDNAKGLTEAEQNKMIGDLRQKVKDSPTFAKIAPQDVDRIQSTSSDWWLRLFLERFIC